MSTTAATLDAVIFDVDGTLAETEEAHRHAFNDAFVEFGLDWNWSQADYKRLLKTTGGKERIRAHMDAIGFEYNGEDSRADYIARLHRYKTGLYVAIIESGAVQLRPGIAELIEECRMSGMRMAIATTTSYPNVVSLLKATLGEGGIELFEVISSGDMVENKKPAPDIFLKALSGLKLDARNCIALEDSFNGLKSATDAAITTIITPSIYTDDDDFTGAALITPTLQDLAAVKRKTILAALSDCLK